MTLAVNAPRVATLALVLVALTLPATEAQSANDANPINAGVFDWVKNYFSGDQNTPTSTVPPIQLADSQCQTALRQCGLLDASSGGGGGGIDYFMTWNEAAKKAQADRDRELHAHYQQVLLQLQGVLVNLLDAAMNDPSATSLVDFCDFEKKSNDVDDVTPAGEDEGGKRADETTTSPTEATTATTPPAPALALLCTPGEWSRWSAAPGAITEQRVRVIVKPGRVCPEEQFLVEYRQTTPTTTTTTESTTLALLCTPGQWSQWSVPPGASTEQRVRVIVNPGRVCPEEQFLVQYRQPQTMTTTTTTITRVPATPTQGLGFKESTTATTTTTMPLAAVCAVGMWGEWSSPLGFGTQERVREILTPGRLCPEAQNLKEYRQVATTTTVSPSGEGQGPNPMDNVTLVALNFFNDFILASEGKPRDLLLILDSSASITDIDFEVMKAGLKLLIDSLCGSFGPAPTQNRLSIIQFSSSVVGKLSFNPAHQNNATLKGVVDALKPMYGYTCTGDALTLAAQAFDQTNGARSSSNSTHDTLVITDGQSNCGRDLLTSSQILQRVSNVYALAIGLSSNQNAADEITSLVSNKDPRHLFSLANFQHFERMVGNVQERHQAHQCAPILADISTG